MKLNTELMCYIWRRWSSLIYAVVFTCYLFVKPHKWPYICITHFSPILPIFPLATGFPFFLNSRIFTLGVEWEVYLYQSYYSWFSFLAESLGLLVYSYLFIWFQSSVSPMKKEKRKQSVRVEILGGTYKIFT